MTDLPSSPSPDTQVAAWLRFVAEVRQRPGLAFAEHWRSFQEIFRDRPAAAGPAPMWVPGERERSTSNLARWIRELGLAGYPELHAWSVAHREEFWQRVIGELGVVFETPPRQILDLSLGPLRPRWLAGARLNIVASCFAAPAEQTAIVSGAEGSDGRRTTTCGELAELSDRVARGFAAIGLVPGDAVALYLPLTVECVAACLGVVKAGGRVVSVAESFPPAELARRLDLGEARAVITVETCRRAGKVLDLYARVRAAAAPRTVVLPGPDGSSARLRQGDLPWESFLGAAGAPPATLYAAEPEAVSHVLFSSGTTGTPKVIPWTHLTPIKCAMDGRFHHDLGGPTPSGPRDVLAWPTSIGWMMGPWLIYASLLNRATMALYDGAATGADFARFVERAGVTMLGVVPSLVRAWREGGACDGADWSGIRLVSSTGEPSAVRDYLWLASRTGYRAPIIEYCGGTEIGGAYITGSVLQPASPATFTTPALGLDFVILDGAGRAVDEGGRGEVFLVPPSIGLSQSLLGPGVETDEHEAVYHHGCPGGPGGEALRRHGDFLALLPGGGFKAEGRADDTMNLGGIKVSSREIERAVEGHPAVYECAAAGVRPGGEGPECLVLWVVLRPDERGEGARREALAGEIRTRIAEELNPLFRLHDLVLVPALPRTASNKLMRRTLREGYRPGPGQRGDS